MKSGSVRPRRYAARRNRAQGFSEAMPPSRPIPSINIKNEETCRLVQELAALTGETLTGAVNEAVRQRLERVRKSGRGDLAERLLAIGRECAAELGEDFRKLDVDALLYDEKGLPR
jgi:antitoxin VapB